MATIRRRNGKWQAQVRRRGFPEVSKTFLLKTDASEWAREQERLADKGELGKPRLNLSQIMLSELVERYLQTVVPIKKSAKTETIVLEAFLRHRICKKSLDKLTTADFAKYRDERLQKVVSATVKRQLNPIHHMFEIARHEWDIPLRANPLDKLSLNYIDRRRERRLKPDEKQRLLEGARQLQNPYISIVIEWALETAMRRGEIVSLTWGQVDLERRSVTILESKNGHSRVFPLTSKAFSLLHDNLPERWTDTDYVFPITGNAIRLAWCRLTRSLNIEDLHFHDLRHEAISSFFEIGLTVPEVAKISGHKDTRMLMRYAHADHTAIAIKLGTLRDEKNNDVRAIGLLV